ncbi:hypothetical protein KUM39_00820 [Streptomyces sp. J2-1]|uniref:hypothetical protein n=1 Tax=Streptomyces corallincola TaxID=2851888 RepID=UPI001C37F4B4|nr:hypothetical protein [Streptomyces corallincola]MBV2352912.1 hypothetical protein [Streptomyces corallincola]
MTTQPRTAVNRAVLALTGFALLVGGVVLFTTAPGLAVRRPTWWPSPSLYHPLFDREVLSDLRAREWWTPVVIAVGAVVSLLLARWFVAQVYVRSRSRLRLAAPGSALRTQALEAALASRAAGVDGVARTRARIHPRRRRLLLRLHVWLDADTPPGHVLDALTAITAEAQRSAAPYVLDTHVRFSHRTHRMPHVR